MSWICGLGGRVDPDDRHRRRQRVARSRTAPCRDTCGARTSGATTATPGVAATVVERGLRQPRLAERRDAQVGPADERGRPSRSTAASIPAFVARPAKSTATPRATPAAVRLVRSGRARRPRQARRLRPRIGSEPELGEAADERRRVVVARAGRARSSSRMRPSPTTQHPVGVRGRLRVVGDEDDRLAPLLARAPQRVEDLGAGRVVEVAGRLVGEEQRRTGHERPGDGDPLLLAGRQLVGLVVLLAGQVDELDDIADAIGRARRVTGPGRRS